MRGLFVSISIVVIDAGLAGADDFRKLEPPPDENVTRVVKTRDKAFRTCYQRELKRDPKLARGGRVVLGADLELSGAVKTVRVESTTLNSRLTEDCLLKVMKELKFPAAAPRTFKYPFKFSAGTGESVAKRTKLFAPADGA